jgi:hypothetical protein
MIKKNENAIRKVKLFHRSNFKPIGIYRNCEKTMQSGHSKLGK